MYGNLWPTPYCLQQGSGSLGLLTQQLIASLALVVVISMGVKVGQEKTVQFGDYGD